MVTLYNGVDAAYPGNPLPDNIKIVAGYIGALDLAGQPDTPHIWTKDEWNLYLPGGVFYQPGIRVLPIYTHDYPGDPFLDSQNAIDAALDLGWSNKLGRFIVWDSEALADNSYASGLKRGLNNGGFRLMTYERNVLQDPACDARWIVSLQATKPRFLPANWNGWQYAFGGHWDLDIFDQSVYDGCGENPRQFIP